MKSIFKDELFQGTGLAVLFVMLLAFLFSLTGCSADIPGVQSVENTELSTRNSEECRFFNSMGDITEHAGYFYTWFNFGSQEIDGLCYLIAMYERGPVIYKIFTDGQYTHGFTGYLCDVKLYYLKVKTGPGAYTAAQAGQFAQMLKNGQVIPENENILLCDYVYHCEEMDHVPADSVTTDIVFSLEAPEISKKGDYYIFEQNFDCVQVYEDGNKFHISGPMPGENQFLVLKYPDGTGSILNMAFGHWLTIYKDLCNVQISYFWADPESYTFTEAQNMAKAIFAGAMVERPGTQTCTVQKLCNPETLTDNQ